MRESWLNVPLEFANVTRDLPTPFRVEFYELVFVFDQLLDGTREFVNKVAQLYNLAASFVNVSIKIGLVVFNEL